MKNKKLPTLLKTVLLLAAFATITFTSCKKKDSPPITEITYTNDTYTPITITQNGITQKIAIGASITYSGAYGTYLTANASTSGLDASNNQLGELITWTLNDPFPSSGDAAIGLDVSSDYFFLQIQNNNISYYATGLYVNLGLNDQTYETSFSVPNNSEVYGIGYYDANPGTELKIYSAPVGTYWGPFPPGLPLTANQTFLWYLP